MHTIKISEQQKELELSTRLEVLNELAKRHALNKKSADERYRLEKGDFGELEVLNSIEKYGAKHWQVLKNIWLEDYGKFECDLILLTNAGIYPFEIKHYSGKFEYREGQCILNGRKIGHNAISQSQKAAIKLQNILEVSFINHSVNAGIIFTGEHCDVKIYDQVKDLDIRMLHQLRDRIREIAQEEKKYQGKSLNIRKFIRVIEKYSTTNPFAPRPISEEIKRNCQLGVLCSHCGSFRVDTTKKYLTCLCGTREPRENAIVRTICEYGVINFDKDLTTKELYHFFNKQYSKVTIRKYLKKHFEEIGNSKSTHFKNRRLSFKYLLPILDLEEKLLQVFREYE